MSQGDQGPTAPSLKTLPTLLVPGSLALASGAAVEETPVAYIASWLRRRMAEYGGRGAAPADRVLIVKAKTGSGKSTALPVAVFRVRRGEGTSARLRYRGPSVLCTQPRVLTAVALASDVPSTYRDMVLGETVGFLTGPVSDTPAAGLIYATAGVLAAQLRASEDADIMARYWCIIVDEAHERSLEADMMLMLLRDFYIRNAGNQKLPFLLLASATITPMRYADYFGVGPENVLTVKGRAFPVATHYLAQGVNDYLVAAAALAVKIHEENTDDPPEQADILVFVPGAKEATALVKALLAANRKYAGTDADADAATPLAGEAREGLMLVLSVNREVVASQSGDYPLLFEKPERLRVDGRRPKRRVIVATVVAETGITIDTLRYVIDCGWSRTREEYQPWRVGGLVTRPAPQSRVKQRRGRAGRRFPGEFFPLYTENVHRALDKQQLPDVITLGPASVYLALVAAQQRQKLRMGLKPEFRVEDIALLDPPPPEALLAANSVAIALGFVATAADLPGEWPVDVTAKAGAEASAARGYGLTPLGHIGAAFTSAAMEGVRILLAGYVWGGAASDLTTLAALLGSKPNSLLALLANAAAGAEAPGAPSLPAGAAALRAALPPYLVRSAGGGPRGGGALPPTEDEAFYFRARLVIADDFIESLLIFDAFATYLDHVRDLTAAEAWCAELGLDLRALLQLAQQREKIIDEMLLVGLDPFRAPEQRLAALPAEAFAEGLVRLKRCMYDGLRCNLLRYDPGEAKYISCSGTAVRVPPLFSDQTGERLAALGQAPPASWQPRWVVTDQLRLAPARQRPEDRAPPLLYEILPGRISVLDGFVSPDPSFWEPRLQNLPDRL